MPWVQMMVYISGGRGDGTDWPQPGQGEHSKLLTGEDECRDLIKGKLAVAADPPPWAYEPPPPPPPPPPTTMPPAPPQIIDEVAPGRGGTNTSAPGTETTGGGTDIKPAATKTKPATTKTTSGSRASSTRKAPATK